MDYVNVQFTLSRSEYEQLGKLAGDRGISIAKYIKDCLPLNQETSFEDLWKELEKRLSSFPSGIEFTIATVMTEERWKSFSRSTKLSLAKQLNKRVSEGKVPQVTLKSKSSANVSIYEKK